MLKVDHARRLYRGRKLYFLFPIHWNSHERTVTKIKAQQRQIKQELHLFFKRCENNVNWRGLCFAFAFSTTQRMLMNYTVNWDIILSVRDQGKFRCGTISDNERQLGVFGRVEKLACRNNNYRFYSTYQEIWKKPLWFLWTLVERKLGYLVLKSPQISQSFSEDLMLWLVHWSLLSWYKSYFQENLYITIPDVSQMIQGFFFGLEASFLLFCFP